MSKVFQPKISFHESTTGSMTSITIDDETLNQIASPGNVELKFDYDNANDVDSDGNVKYIDRGDVISEIMKSMGDTAIFDVPTIIKPGFNYTENIGEFESSPFKTSVAGCRHVRTIWELSSFDDFDDSSSSDKNVIVTLSSGDLTKTTMTTFPSGNKLYCKCTYIAELNGDEISLTSAIRTIYSGNTERLSYEGIKATVNGWNLSSGLISTATLCKQLGWIKNINDFTDVEESRIMQFFKRVGRVEKRFVKTYTSQSVLTGNVDNITMSFKYDNNTNSISLKGDGTHSGIKMSNSSGYSIYSSKDDVLSFNLDGILSGTCLVNINIKTYSSVFGEFNQNKSVFTCPFLFIYKGQGSGADDSLFDEAMSMGEFDVTYSTLNEISSYPGEIIVEYEFFHFLESFQESPVTCKLKDPSTDDEITSDWFLGKKTTDFKLEFDGGTIKTVNLYVRIPDSNLNPETYYDVSISRKSQLDHIYTYTISPRTIGVGGGRYKVFGVSCRAYIVAEISYFQDLKDGSRLDDDTVVYFQVNVGENLGLGADNFFYGSYIDNTGSGSITKCKEIRSVPGKNKIDVGMNFGCNLIQFSQGDSAIATKGNTKSMFSSEPDFVNGYVIPTPYFIEYEGQGYVETGEEHFRRIYFFNNKCSLVPSPISSTVVDENIYISFFRTRIPSSSADQEFYKDDDVDYWTWKIRSEEKPGYSVHANTDFSFIGLLEYYVCLNVNIVVDLYNITSYNVGDKPSLVVGEDFAIEKGSTTRITTFIRNGNEVRSGIHMINYCTTCKKYHEDLKNMFRIGKNPNTYTDTVYKQSIYPRLDVLTDRLENRQTFPELYKYGSYGYVCYDMLGGIRSVIRSEHEASGVPIDMSDTGEMISSVIRLNTINLDECYVGKVFHQNEVSSDQIVCDTKCDFKLRVNGVIIDTPFYIDIMFIRSGTYNSVYPLDFDPRNALIAKNKFYTALKSSESSAPSIMCSIESFIKMSLGTDSKVDPKIFAIHSTNRTPQFYVPPVGGLGWRPDPSTTIDYRVSSSNRQLTGVKFGSLSNHSITYGTSSAELNLIFAVESNLSEKINLIGGVVAFRATGGSTYVNVDGVYGTITPYQSTQTDAQVQGCVSYTAKYMTITPTRTHNISLLMYSAGESFISSGSGYDSSTDTFNLILIKGVGNVSIDPSTTFRIKGATYSVDGSDLDDKIRGSSSYYGNTIYDRVIQVSPTFGFDSSPSVSTHLGRFVCRVREFLDVFYPGIYATDINYIMGNSYSEFVDMSEAKPVTKITFRRVYGDMSGVIITSYSGSDVVDVKSIYTNTKRFSCMFKIFANRGGALDYMSDGITDFIIYDNGEDVNYQSTFDSSIKSRIPSFVNLNNKVEEDFGEINFNDPTFCWVWILYDAMRSDLMLAKDNYDSMIIRPTTARDLYRKEKSLKLKRRIGNYSSITLKNTVKDFADHKLGYLWRLSVNSLPTCRMTLKDFYKLIKGTSPGSGDINNLFGDTNRDREGLTTFHSFNDSNNKYITTDQTRTFVECCSNKDDWVVDPNIMVTHYRSPEATNQSVCSRYFNGGIAGKILIMLVRRKDNGEVCDGLVAIASTTSKDNCSYGDLQRIFPSIKVFGVGEGFYLYEGPYSYSGMSSLSSGVEYYVEYVTTK